jgi:glycosyltransferase involved in cell wall biosynthesis
VKITFVVPFVTKPSGGLRIVYEYANQLVARGHKVTVVHVPLSGGRSPRLLSRLYHRLTGKGGQLSKSVFRPPQVSSYTVDNRVKMIFVAKATESCFPDADALFINRWFQGTKLTESKGKKFMLIQGYGVWPQVKAQEEALWRMHIPKAVISRWLYEKGIELGVPADGMIHIPNGIDHAKYRLLRAIETRPQLISMLYNPVAVKGAEDGIKALELVRENVPAIRAVLFSFFTRPDDLPDWIEYHRNPSQEMLVESIYNGSSIYLYPSWSEGFGLTAAEAMACGCAVVSTDSGGVRDYAEHEVTALLSPPRNPGALAANVLRLLDDDDLRVRLAKAGHECIQEFTWERSAALLEQFIKEKIGR